MNKPGCLFVISAPSGAGKSTLCNMMLKKYPHIQYSVSYTTRQPRNNELNGRDYYFVDCDTFKKMIDSDEFIEWAKVHGNYYGTSKKIITDTLKAGKDIFLDIDPQGVEQLKKTTLDSVYIFITAPSINELKTRLIKRNTDNKDSIELRLKNSKQEISSFAKYDYLIVNENTKKALNDLEAIYKAEKLKTKYINTVSDFMIV